MSLFANNGSKSSCGSTLFRDTSKLLHINNTISQLVTKNVTERIERSNLLYKNLYDDVGNDIQNILTAFVTGSDELKTLIDYENYGALADKLHSHLNEDNQDLENFRNLLIDAIEGAKKSSNRILEQEHAYKKLLDAYNSLINPNTIPAILEASTTSELAAEIKPEILEYIHRGYQIVDGDGKLIPLDMTIIAEIRKDLDITTLKKTLDNNEIRKDLDITTLKKTLDYKEIRKDIDITTLNKALGKNEIVESKSSRNHVSRWALKPTNTECRTDYKPINELYVKTINPIPKTMAKITGIVTNKS